MKLIKVKYSEHFTGRKESVPLNSCLLSTALNNVKMSTRMYVFWEQSFRKKYFKTIASSEKIQLIWNGHLLFIHLGPAIHTKYYLNGTF